MFFAKHKKVLIGFAAVAALSLGGVTALAASVQPSLTPAGYVDLSKVEILPGSCTVVKGVTPHIEGGTGTTAPAPALAAVSEKIDAANAKKGSFKAVKSIDLKEIVLLSDGQSFTTAAK